MDDYNNNREGQECSDISSTILDLLFVRVRRQAIGRENYAFVLVKKGYPALGAACVRPLLLLLYVGDRFSLHFS